MADSRPRANGEWHNDSAARTTSADFRMTWPGWIFKPVVLSKREVIGIPSGRRKTLRPLKRNQARIGGEPHQSAGPARTPGIVRGGDELAQRRGLLPAIHFHDLKYKPAERITAIRCSPHLGPDEFFAPWSNRLMSWGAPGGILVRWLGGAPQRLLFHGASPGYRTMTSGGRTSSSGARTSTTGGPTMTAS